MSERDELARTIEDVDIANEWDPSPGMYLKYGDAILAAGYRKPRVITTAEELDALPIGSIVRCEDEEGFGMNVAERKKAGWEYVGSSITFQSFHLAADELPFTVLWEPR